MYPSLSSVFHFLRLDFVLKNSVNGCFLLDLIGKNPPKGEQSSMRFVSVLFCKELNR